MIFKKSNIFVAIILFSLTCCAPIARMVSTPTYSQHNDERICLDYKNNVGSFFIKKGLSKESLQTKITNDIELKLKKAGANIVSDINNADYILSVNIRNISSGLDYQFANKMRNVLLSKEANFSYIFDNNNSPHVNNGSITPFFDKGSKTMYRRLFPSTLYSLLGGSAGFAVGYMLAGANMPFMFGLCGALATGGLTYVVYNYFHKIGIIVSYEITIDEKRAQSLNHNRKILTKKSSNSTDETYYSYTNNWNSMISKNIIIGIGSKALTKDMMEKIHLMIVDDVIDVFKF